MEEEKLNFLLGADPRGNLVFVEARLGKKLDNKYLFTCSFSIVRPFDIEEVDEDKVWEAIDDFPADVELDYLHKYNCAPRELARVLMANENYIELVMDCSLYPQRIAVNDRIYAFESICCGQCDLTKECGRIEETPTRNFYFAILDLWVNYHLKDLTQEEIWPILSVFCQIKDAYKDVDEKKWIANYLKNRVD